MKKIRNEAADFKTCPCEACGMKVDTWDYNGERLCFACLDDRGYIDNEYDFTE